MSSSSSTESNPIVERVKQKLFEALAPIHFELVDNSWMHKHHPGNIHGGSHLAVTVVSERFNGLNAMQRHRLVHELLKEEMAGPVHALELKALPPSLFKG